MVLERTIEIDRSRVPREAPQISSLSIISLVDVKLAVTQYIRYLALATMN